MSEALPPGWAEVKFGAITINHDGKRVPVKASDRAARRGTYRYFGAQGVIDHVDDYLFDGTYLLIAEDGANLVSRVQPIAQIATGQFWVNNHAHVVESANGISLKFLEHFINGNALSGAIRGTAQPKLTQADLNGLAVAVPPTAEQARIVAAIEEQFSRLDAGVAALGRVRQNIKRMRAVVLESAVMGLLLDEDTSDGYGDLINKLKPLPSGWSVVSVDDVAEVSGGITKNPKRAPRDNAVPFLRVANVMRDQLDLSEVHQIEVFAGELERFRLQRGDLLVVEGNGSADQIGRSALWDGSIDPCVHQNHLIRIRPASKILPEYLNVFWNAPSSMATIQAAASSTSGLHTLSTGKVRRVQVALPPLPEQNRIVKEVDRQLSALSALDHQLGIEEVRARRLRTAILAAAFSGQLVPQDPREEPASILVKRIAAERAASNGHKLTPGRKPRVSQETVTT